MCYHRLLKFLFLCVIIVCSCNRNPYKASNKIYKEQSKTYAQTLRVQPNNINIDSISITPYFIGTTNFNMRKPNFVIIHHTAQNACAETISAFTNIQSQVSAHYVICKDGTVHHMLNDYLRAWHAGVSKWGNLIDVNSASIGIELDNNGFENFTDAQITSLLHVLTYLKRTYNIPTANFIGHGDIAPVRKNDPNVFFPWKMLADKGFGLWYSDTTAMLPQGFNNLTALRLIGYDITDSSAAIRAFKQHFEMDTTRILTEADQKILYNLSMKY